MATFGAELCIFVSLYSQSSDLKNAGEELESTTYDHDFASSELPIFSADHVTVESGSGLVHTAPSHGLEDFHAYTDFMT
ncbi:class I tRNA ligase family protein, partial [Listeria monocytogenes]